jgi:hypothetical protein
VPGPENLLATHSEARVPSLVLEHYHTHDIGLFTVDNNVRKILEADASEYFALTIEGELSWSSLDGRDARPKLSLESFRQMGAPFNLVVIQRSVEI